ncbi:MAG: hypothetical protein PHE17_16385 [Thiothrix sp.]|uniref:hypothetical protein n=1 Tax=Thiothrix sp. TaxID=1032 RepID=UPI002627D22E|nr:hypothetical protein [Thiothrix sp.]MDD5394594.1 hypothetical protein [Thiothrix sp.]
MNTAANPKTNAPTHPQPRAATGAAGAKLKTFGTFAAGGLVSAVITSALLHGWGSWASNGLNPFGDGGKSAYKDTDAQTGTAPKAGLAVRPSPATPVVVLAMLPTPPAAQASRAGVDVGFVPTVRQTGKTTQPVLASGEALAQAPAVATVAAHKPAARTGSKPVAASAAAGKTGGGAASGGNWITALMPGEAKSAPSPYYYEYTAPKGGKASTVTQPKATLPAASGNNWVASLMGNQPIKRTAGRASPYQTTSTALGSAAGVGGDRLTGGGTDSVWAKGDFDLKPKDPNKSRLSVCLEKGGMVSGCVTEDF